ncbi:hypothetical protein EIP86_011055 [Pleurotus ostreatoroseus]|nr:hypothetical protein EIP86_008907 [Pleurotus ostreatoroseus]KAF7799813.1 hypothetical protein EIP86_011055 [Pleurotus ostreatoroseus]
MADIIAIDDVNWVKNLQACSLVCLEWLPEARKHLFRTIAVIDNHPIKNIDRFIQLLTQSPAICGCIRSVSLRASYVQIGPGTPITDELVAFILDRLINLKCLEVDGLRFDASGMSYSQPFYLRKIERLRVVNQRAWTSVSQALLDALSLFCEIDELIFDGVGELKDSIFVNDEFGFGFGGNMISNLDKGGDCVIKQLSLHSVAQLHFFLEVLKHKHAIPNLQLLLVSCGHPVHVPAFARDLGLFLARDGAHIPQLGIELTGCFRHRTAAQVEEDITKIFNSLLPGLSQMHSLHVFGLLLPFPSGPNFPHMIWRLLIATLLALPHTMQRVQIGLEVDKDATQVQDPFFNWRSPWTSPQFDWGLLRHALARFPRLETVRLVKSCSNKQQQILGELNAEERIWVTSSLTELVRTRVLVFDLE